MGDCAGPPEGASMSADGLLKDIIENPEDDAPRLIYADWLDDNGEAERAEFIRAQIELSRTSERAPRRKELLAREAELWERHGESWRSQLPALRGVKWLDWSRGFVWGVRIDSASAFRSHAATVFAT